MERIVVISQDQDIITALRNLLQPFQNDYALEEGTTLSEVSRRLAGKPVGAVVYGIDWLTDIEVTRISNFRSQNLETPMVIVGRSESKKILDSLKAIPWVLFLETPYSVFDAQHLIERLMEHKEIRVAVHRRYPTETKGWMESGPQKVTVRVTNISLGGVCCETSINETWLPGTLVQLRLVLTELGRERIMKAFVVWSRKDEATQIQRVGLQFKAS